MKKAIVVIVALVIAGAMSACATPTKVHKTGANTYLVCDEAAHGDCEGANPEKGVEKVCLPHGEVIAKIEQTSIGQGVLVTCAKGS